MLDDSHIPAADNATAELLAKVDRLNGTACGECGRTLCGHQVLFAIALGMANRPLCHSCLASSLGRSPEALRDDLWQHFRHRDCYGTVWNLATNREPRRADGFPCCLWPTQPSWPPQPASAPNADSVRHESDAGSVPHEWDAGDLACGDLLLQLRMRLRNLPPGSILHLTSQDRGAIEDIPAWCRLTGNRLRSADHPFYVIERKQD